MTSESKILTVSYGTFSCTLEGFDNPFDTMKAIAEYFRDLAAQDRHFGAEPPPPDAAMLHRLAEREVSRLAAGKAEDAARRAAADVAEAPSPRIQINPVLRRSAPLVAPEPPLEADPAAPEPSLTDAIPDGVAAKLARIRKGVTPVAPLAETGFVADPGLSDPEPAAEDSAAPDAADADAAAPAVEDLSDVVARLGALVADDAAAVETVPETGLAEIAEADAHSEDDAPAFLVAAADDASLADDTLAEAEDAPLPVEADPETLVSLLDDADDLALAEPLEDDFTSGDVALLAQLDGTDVDEAGLARELDATQPEDQPVALDLAEASLQDPLPEETAPEETAFQADVDALPASAEADAPTLAEAAEADAGFAEPAAEVQDAPAVEAPILGKAGSRTRRVNSRVVRIHPTEDLRDPASTRPLDGDDDEVSRLMQQAEEVMAEDENRRRHEALSRLKAAVVATEADRADLDYEAPKAEANLDPYRDDLAEAIQPTPAPAPQPEAEVKPSRRKSVVIRPATEPRPGTIRPGMISPPPLVLVSEQRVDRIAPAAAPAPAPAAAPAPSLPPAPEGQPMVALRTGRLSSAIGAGAAVAASSLPARNLVLEKPTYGQAAESDEDEDLAEDAKEINEAGLASFAEMVGARSMAEMLEAAAAYATCVENRRQFTRPQLMRRMMASAGGKPVSREDGLRSFGTLLRTGRIEKVTRGHYSLAETSPYLAEARRLS
jgi:hypothetical protein